MAVKPPQQKAVAVINRFIKDDLVLIWLTIFIAWVIVFCAAFTGQEHLLHHDQMIEHNHQPLVLKLVIFLLAWQVMTAAMMLPSTLPMLKLFVDSSREQPRKNLALLAFLGAYATIWTGFGLIFFVGDMAIHSLVHHWHWLHERPWLIFGSTLILAGGFQFSFLKKKYLKICRHPLGFVTDRYQRGIKAAWNLGLQHGLSCVACCWALMLLMFAIGVGHIISMIVLTVLMTLERTWKQGRSLAKIIGFVLLIWGSLALINPTLLPALN
jgi:predicted metal-binding membrane protein